MVLCIIIPTMDESIIINTAAMGILGVGLPPMGGSNIIFVAADQNEVTQQENLAGVEVEAALLSILLEVEALAEEVAEIW